MSRWFSNLSVLVLVATASVWCGQALAEETFWENHEEGWFFYEEPVVEEEPEEPEPQEMPIAQAEAPSEPKGPSPLSAKWFRENLDHYRDLALDNPTPENVSRYYYLQRVMFDKADRFSAMARQVVVTDPLLDENSRSPRASFAALDNRRQATFAKQEMVKAIAERAGLYFFFASNCPYCHKQAPILDSMQKTYGLKVAAISIDHKPMPGPLYTSFLPDQGQAKALGVMSTPALYLVKPGKDIVPLVQGAISEGELIERIIVAAHKAGIITEEEFNSTTTSGDAPMIALGGEGEGSTKLLVMDEDTVNDAGDFLKKVKNALRNQQ
jgi:conjugal transfer pilus assembly protein TraF